MDLFRGTRGIPDLLNPRRCLQIAWLSASLHKKIGVGMDKK
jgi:hypothetical protein